MYDLDSRRLLVIVSHPPNTDAGAETKFNPIPTSVNFALQVLNAMYPFIGYPPHEANERGLPIMSRPLLCCLMVQRDSRAIQRIAMMPGFFCKTRTWFLSLFLARSSPIPSAMQSFRR